MNVDGRLGRRFAMTALGSLSLALGVAVRADDWPAYLAGPGHNAYVAERVAPPLSIRWNVSLPGKVESAAAIAGDRILVPCHNGKLYALNAADGSTAWSFSTGQPIHATPAVSNGRVFLAGRNGTLYALRLTDGSLLWSKVHGGNQIGSPAVIDGRVIVSVGSPSREVRCYGEERGELRWAADAGNLANTSPASDGTRVYVGAGHGGWTALDLQTGAPVWTFQGPSGVFTSSASVGDGLVAISPGQEDLKVYLLDPASGALVRSFEPDVPPAAPAPKATVTGAAKAGKSAPASGTSASRSADVPEGGSAGVAGPSVDFRQIHPLELVDGEMKDLLLDMPDRAQRESLLAIIEKDRGCDLSRLRDYLAILYGEKKPEDVIGRPLNAAPVDLSSGAAPAGSEPTSSGKSGKAGATAGPVASAKGAAAPAGSSVSQKGSGNISPTGAIDSGTPVLHDGSLYVLERALGSSAHEYLLYKVNPATGVSVWAKSRIVTWTEIPGFSPSPVISGDVVYTPMGDTLYAFDDATGAELGSLQADEEIFTTPAVGNGLVVFASRMGTVYAAGGDNHAPAAPSALNPAEGVNIREHRPTLNWTAGVDPDAGDPAGTLVSEIQVGYDANVDTAPAFTRRLAPGVTHFAFEQELQPSTHVFFRVRAIDDGGAASGWSSIADFWVDIDSAPPDPPVALEAIPMDGSVLLTWRASPSLDVAGYRVYYKPSASGFSEAVTLSVGDVRTATVTGLSNYVSYDFMLTAIDRAANESPGAVVSAVPVPAITINQTGVGYATLAEALAAAQPGDVVHLGVGSFTAGVAMPRGVVLRGVSPRLTVLTGGGAPSVLRLTGSRRDLPVAISNLALTDGVVGLDAGHAKVTVRNVVIARLAGSGVIGASDAKVDLVNVTVADNAGDGIAVASSLLNVRNAIVVNNGRSGIRGAQGAQVHYSDVHGNALGDLVDVASGPNPGNFSMPVRFVDAAVLDYRELEGEPSVDAGSPQDPYKLEPAPNGERINIGAFGNTVEATRTTGGGKQIKKAGLDAGGAATSKSAASGASSRPAKASSSGRRPAAGAPGAITLIRGNADEAEKGAAEDAKKTDGAAEEESPAEGADRRGRPGARHPAASAAGKAAAVPGEESTVAVAEGGREETSSPGEAGAEAETGDSAEGVRIRSTDFRPAPDRAIAARSPASNGSAKTSSPAGDGGCFLDSGEERGGEPWAVVLLLIGIPVFALRRRPAVVPVRIPASRR